MRENFETRIGSYSQYRLTPFWKCIITLSWGIWQCFYLRFVCTPGPVHRSRNRCSPTGSLKSHRQWMSFCSTIKRSNGTSTPIRPKVIHQAGFSLAYKTWCTESRRPKHHDVATQFNFSSAPFSMRHSGPIIHAFLFARRLNKGWVRFGHLFSLCSSLGPRFLALGGSLELDTPSFLFFLNLCTVNNEFMLPRERERIIVKVVSSVVVVIINVLQTTIH